MYQWIQTLSHNFKNKKKKEEKLNELIYLCLNRRAITGEKRENQRKQRIRVCC